MRYHKMTAFLWCWWLTFSWMDEMLLLCFKPPIRHHLHICSFKATVNSQSNQVQTNKGAKMAGKHRRPLLLSFNNGRGYIGCLFGLHSVVSICSCRKNGCRHHGWPGGIDRMLSNEIVRSCPWSYHYGDMDYLST